MVFSTVFNFHAMITFYRQIGASQPIAFFTLPSYSAWTAIAQYHRLALIADTTVPFWQRGKGVLCLKQKGAVCSPFSCVRCGMRPDGHVGPMLAIELDLALPLL